MTTFTTAGYTHILGKPRNNPNKEVNKLANSFGSSWMIFDFVATDTNLSLNLPYFASNYFDRPRSLLDYTDRPTDRTISLMEKCHGEMLACNITQALTGLM